MAETERWIEGFRSRTRRTTVPLPTPEGPATTNSLPSPAASGGYFFANSPRSDSRCFAPRPRTRRLAE
ncbi:MAG TPA: hypothetical protein VIH70_09060, partial [Actinomycetota bacterium]